MTCFGLTIVSVQ